MYRTHTQGGRHLRSWPSSNPVADAEAYENRREQRAEQREFVESEYRSRWLESATPSDLLEACDFGDGPQSEHLAAYLLTQAQAGDAAAQQLLGWIADTAVRHADLDAFRKELEREEEDALADSLGH